jgi:predicted dehydrogenase
MTTSDPGRLRRRTFVASSLASLLAARTAPAFVRRLGSNDVLRLGFVGLGGRGVQMLRTLGYGDPEVKGPALLPRLTEVEVVAVCDPFQTRVDQAVGEVRRAGGEARGYADYHAMLEKEKLDAAIIASTDHHHAPATIAAMNAGCDVYVEKCMTNSLEELKHVRETMQRTGKLLQVGHQGRQDFVHRGARDLVARQALGKIAVVQTFLSRAGIEQAWLRPGLVKNHATAEGIAWDAFLGNAPRRDYDAQRFFEWRRFWDYSTGIAGDLMSHEIDTVHHVLGLGVPTSAVASGGVYFWKDGRETPDTYSVVLEYADPGLSVTYSANLHNNYHRRPSLFLGSEATMELDWECRVFADRGSEKYGSELKANKISVGEPMISIGKRAGQLTTKASASNLWLEYEGLLTTLRDGETKDTSRLHHEEFYRCMRDRTQPSASFEACYATTVATHLSVVAFKTGRKATWDPKSETAVY